LRAHRCIAEHDVQLHFFEQIHERSQCSSNASACQAIPSFQIEVGTGIEPRKRRVM
jgi:hypothetical protein